MKSTYNEIIKSFSDLAELRDADGTTGLSEKRFKNIVQMASLVDGVVTDNTYKKVAIYVGTKAVTPKELRDIKLDISTLYLFLGGLFIINESRWRGNDSVMLSNIPERNECVIKISTDGYGEYTVDTLGKNIIITAAGLQKREELCQVLEQDNYDSLIHSMHSAEKDVDQETTIEKIRKTIENKIASEKALIIEKINDIEDCKNQSYQEYIKYCNNIKEYEAKLAYIDKNFSVASMLDRCNKLFSIRGIESFEINDFLKDIDLYTSDIYINSIGYKFYIGKFKINVNMSENKVSFENLTSENKRHSAWGDYCMHPHISDRGIACLGEAAEPIMMACKDFRIDILAIILISYLESINPDDSAGKNLTNWDVVDENGNVMDFPIELTPCHLCLKKVTDSNKDTFHICEDCNKNYCDSHISPRQTKNGTKFICDECFEHYRVCDVCGNVTLNFDLCNDCGIIVCNDCCTSIGGHHYCPECANNYVEKECSKCGAKTVISVDDDTDELFVCQSCAEKKCPVCGEYSDNALILVEDNKYICRECYSNTGCCSFCGTRKKLEELNINEAAGMFYCKDGCI